MEATKQMQATELNLHIVEKITYHNKLRLKYEVTEEYEQCAIHRDHITKLEAMLD